MSALNLRRARVPLLGALFVLLLGVAASGPGIGRWLPGDGGKLGSVFWQRGEAIRTARADAFVYRGKTGSVFFGGDGPSDGTPFAYGDAGPVKGRVVYDARGRTAFFYQGCCSWNEVVANADVTHAPPAVARRDLRGLRTLRGVRLGDSIAAVRRIYGNAPLRALRDRPERVLAYTTRAPRSRANSGCGQDEVFAFRAGRLVFIQLTNGC